MRSRGALAERGQLPRLDATDDITLAGEPVDLVDAKPGDPVECAFAHTCRRAGISGPIVLRDVTYAVGRATAKIIEHNRQRGRDVSGIKLNDRVLLRHINDSRLRYQIELMDTEGRTFVPGTFTIRAPSPGQRIGRAKANGTRRERYNGPPQKRRRPPQLMRVARANAMGFEAS